MSLLESINNHTTLTAVPKEKLPLLAEEIREKLIETVSRNGGHLAANLGIVELTIALERCFDAAHDRIIWDVGHQSYVHKLLTGRYDTFDSLRQPEGISGFPSPIESECDAFISGHAGNALSAASGIASGFKLAERNEKVIAVVGDAAIACGISMEALNHVAKNCGNLLMVLNDNSMAISKTVGSFSTHLTRLITNRRYNKAKEHIKKMLGEKSRLSHFISRLTDMLKFGMIPTSFFDAWGIRYFGPIDGHDITEMERTFKAVKDLKYPVLVHVVTTKGKGYEPAENDPEKFHGISAWVSRPANPKSKKDFSACFGDKITDLATKDHKICAITAGMPKGTGLAGFASKFPERFFDVGIAEEHAAVFAGGLAAAGMKPVLALYSSFSQRSFDCFFQDISLAGGKVILALDRAGAVEDGPTHHGIRDIALLRTLKNFIILAPATGKELEIMLVFALNAPCPVAIRYPRGVPPENLPEPEDIVSGEASILAEGSDCAIWALGKECETALKIRETLATQGISAKVVNPRFLAPFDKVCATACAAAMPVFTIEDHLLEGGLYSIMSETVASIPAGNCGIYGFGWRNDPGHGNTEILKKKNGLTADAIAEKIFATMTSLKKI